MQGVMFDDMHSYRDWGLLLNEVDAPNPSVKTSVIEVAGSSEIIDLSEIYGEINYSQRKLSFVFKIKDTSRMKLFEQNGVIANKVHGKRMKITLDTDKEHYYIGRVNMDESTLDKVIGTVKVTCTCDPYRYDVRDSTEEWIWDTFSFEHGIIREYRNIKVDSHCDLTIVGTAKRVYPTVTCDIPMTFSIGNDSIEIPAGKHVLYELPVASGEEKRNLHIECDGVGYVTIQFRGCTF